jgi:hypothetical protein
MSVQKLMKPMYFLVAAALILSLTAAALPQRARAMEVRPDNGNVGVDEVINDDLIINGNTIDMAGTVNGNVIAAGGSITISGTVHGDVIASGGIIRVTGTVDGNVIGCGNSMELDGTVTDSVFFGGYSAVLGPKAAIGRNFYAGGFNIEMQSGSAIDRDVAVGAYQLILGGTIKRDVNAGVGALNITGEVGRNVTAEVGKPSAQKPSMTGMQFTGNGANTYFVPVEPINPGIQVASTAKIGGKFSYTSAVNQSNAILVKPAGGIEYVYRAEPDDSAKNSNNFNPLTALLEQVMGILREFMVLVIAGALAVWLIPGWLIRGRDMLSVKPGPSFLWGLLLIISVPIASFLAAILIFLLGIALGIVTFGGLMGQVWMIGLGGIGLFDGIFSAVVFFCSKLVVSLLLGTWIMRILKKDYVGGIIWPLLLGLVAYTILYAVPLFIGWILSAVIIIFGVGAIWLVIQDNYQTRKAQPAG